MIYRYMAQRIDKHGVVQELEFDPDIDNPKEVELMADAISGEWVYVYKVALEKDLLIGAYR